MRVIICGDRKWDDAKMIYRAMLKLTTEDTVLEGEAAGADTIARVIADLRDISVEKYPADWCDFNGTCQKPHQHFGRGAGVRRNQVMIEQSPDEVWAFHNSLTTSKGTMNMIQFAINRDVPFIVFSTVFPAGVRNPAIPSIVRMKTL